MMTDPTGDDLDHLRDTPDLPGHHATRHPLDRDTPETRRTPLIRPLMMTPIEAWDFDLGLEL